MRSLLVGLLLALPALAGCFAAETEDPAAVAGAGLDLASIVVPEGAELVADPAGAILRFANVTLPYSSNFTLPAGATIVRAVATVPEGVSVTSTMWNEETGRRRCNADALDAWNLGITTRHQCSGLAAIDPPGAMWRVSANAPPISTADPVTGEATVPQVGTVEVVFETTPLDGLASRLDLSQLSMPTHELQETQYLRVPSFDGTSLWVEVTLPQGEGPWPTVIASSPYNGQAGRGATPAMWTYFTHDWAKRGYAIVNVDVRGFGMSDGCVEVWSENEQRDQAFIVDWVAQQEWSDGNVGFYGQSYVGTTPVAAAVQAPVALKAIIAVAPVINAYYDWHYGGVPNGENSLSPVSYQFLTDQPNPNVAMEDPLTFALNAARGKCHPQLAAESSDPRAIYDAFYVERNFSARADQVKAAVLYTQGFEDSNVKSAMIPWWFNEIESPKLGIFGHWVHQHPTRADEEIMFLGWMDQYVKGKPVGFENVGPAEIIVDDDTYRVAQAWPPVDATDLALKANFGDGTLSPDHADGPTATLAMTPANSALPVAPPMGEVSIPLAYEVAEDFAFGGIARLSITGTLQGAGNAYFYAMLYDDDGETSKLMSYGMFNLAHRGGHDTYEPATATSPVSFELPFLPTEHVFRAGHTLRVVLTATSAADTLDVPTQPAMFELGSGDATQLLLPLVPLESYAPTPATALR